MAATVDVAMRCGARALLGAGRPKHFPSVRPQPLEHLLRLSGINSLPDGGEPCKSKMCD